MINQDRYRAYILNDIKRLQSAIKKYNADITTLGYYIRMLAIIMNHMDLPLANRKIALTRFIGIEIVLLIVAFFLYGDKIMNEATITDSWTILILFNILVFFIYFFLNNLQSGRLEGEEVKLKYNWKTIIIPVDEIIKVTTASNKGDILKGTYSNSYFIKLKNRHLFGKSLVLSYDNLKSLNDEPISIKIIKSIKPELK